jgi:hypothetical protein
MVVAPEPSEAWHAIGKVQVVPVRLIVLEAAPLPFGEDAANELFCALRSEFLVLSAGRPDALHRSGRADSHDEAEVGSSQSTGFA